MTRGGLTCLQEGFLTMDGGNFWGLNLVSSILLVLRRPPLSELYCLAKGSRYGICVGGICFLI